MAEWYLAQVKSEQASASSKGKQTTAVSNSIKVSQASNPGAVISRTGTEEVAEEATKAAWLRNEYEFLQRKLRSGRLLDDYENGLVAQYEESSGEKPKSGGEAEIEDLRAKLERMQRQLDQLTGGKKE